MNRQRTLSGHKGRCPVCGRDIATTINNVLISHNVYGPRVVGPNHCVGTGQLAVEVKTDV